MAPCVRDTAGLLPAIEWRTRDAFLELGNRVCKQLGGRYALKTRPLGGRRSCAQQRTIYAQGRSTPGEIVTQADGCVSWHVMGQALDIDPVDAQTGAGVSQGVYAQVGALWRDMGGTWGGDFPGFPDVGHFEWHPGQRIESVCPVPSACRDDAIDTRGPGAWLWAVAGAAVIGAAAFVFYDDLERGISRARQLV